MNCRKLVFCVLSEQLLHPPHNSSAATFLIFVKNLLEFKRKTQVFLEFNVCSWIATKICCCLHCYIMFFEKQPPEVFYDKSVLRNFTKLAGKHLWQSLFFNKVACLRPATFLKKRLWYRCFPVNFVKLLRKPFLQNTSGPLLLCFEHAQIFQISRVIWGIIW